MVRSLIVKWSIFVTFMCTGTYISFEDIMSNERIIYVGKPPDSRLMKRVDREDIPIHTAKKIKIMRL